MSWTYWKSRFNLDPRILGTGILVQERPGAAPAEPSVSATVVGVADHDFRGLVVGYEPDVWIPSAAHPNKEKLGFALIARLKPEATIERARAEMRVLDRPRIEEFASRDPQWLKVRLDVESARAGLWTPLVGDAKYADVRSPAPPTMYLYSSQLFNPPSEFSLRTSVPPAAVAGEVRRVINDVFGNVPVKKVTTLAEQVDASIVPERLVATLSGFFGGLGLLLATIGLYGLLAYLVARRTKEIGVRIALGATGRDVMGMVLRTAWRLVCAGLLVGAPAAFWSTRIAASMLENLSVGGPLPIVAAALALVGVALLAAYVPARRATLVDPLVALRAE